MVAFFLTVQFNKATQGSLVMTKGTCVNTHMQKKAYPAKSISSITYHIYTVTPTWQKHMTSCSHAHILKRRAVVELWRTKLGPGHCGVLVLLVLFLNGCPQSHKDSYT